MTGLVHLHVRLAILLAAIGLVILTVAPPALADDADPAAVVRGLGDRAVAMLRDESLTPERRQETFRELLSEGFDMPRVARFVLGRYWRRATEAQRDEYLRLFEDYVVGSYGARLSAYGGETLRIADSRPDGIGYAVVRSQVVRPEGPPIAINWRLYDGDFGWRIVDVVVEGVSLSLVQRSEFTSVIRSGGGNIEALLGALRKKRGLRESGLADNGRSAG